MGAEKPELIGNQEISWRLKELGPELRRALFEKALHPLGADGGSRRTQGESRTAGPEHQEPTGPQPKDGGP